MLYFRSSPLKTFSKTYALQALVISFFLFFGNFFFKSDYSNEVCLLGHDLLLLSSSLHWRQPVIEFFIKRLENLEEVNI